ncbi:D-glucuronyl C5-epimerase family protein [Desulfitobacterium sp. AusDCA]|uniref:D-glucuronyl C5-epimerase family protein n=1 Tax=Desulfitobacterium sp. AusDCA TaxID=3240383 RepID=UPI003DA79F80
MNIIQMIRAYSGMVFGKTDYWHPDMNVNRELNSKIVRKYPVDISTKADYAGEFDEDGIPLVEVDGHLSYLPVTIAQYALGNYDQWLEMQKPLYRERFVCAADWLQKNLREYKAGLWGWLNDHDKEMYHLKKPWLSALSQGQALSVLARAYLETQEKRYLEAGEKALISFSVPVQQGGVLTQWEGLDYFEEYPSQIPSLVLNGFIFALWGLWEFYVISQDPGAKERYQTGVATLKTILPKYQVSYLNWSRYDLYPFKVADITSIFYHKLHIQQLKAMALLIGEESFNRQAELWEKGRQSFICYWLATAYKVRHKLSIRKESSYVPSVKQG